ncbi:MAG: putative pterin-binding protein [Saccharospirillum sp.]
MPKPTGAVILTVSGNIQHTNNGELAEFDRDMLQRLTQGTIVTENPWTDGINTYEGPDGQALMAAVGAQGEVLTLTALNDYSAEMPRSDLEAFGVIFATYINGDRLRVRDRGPLFVIYPFTDAPELNGERYHNRSVWQVNRIVVR